MEKVLAVFVLAVVPRIMSKKTLHSLMCARARLGDCFKTVFQTWNTNEDLSNFLEIARLLSPLECLNEATQTRQSYSITFVMYSLKDSRGSDCLGVSNNQLSSPWLVTFCSVRFGYLFPVFFLLDKSNMAHALIARKETAFNK